MLYLKKIFFLKNAAFSKPVAYQY